jgi:hypothetical protein
MSSKQNEVIQPELSEENLKLLAGFRLMDDDFMTIVFDRNIEATEFILNIILERTDLKVLEVVAQREYKSPIANGRTIELDIYARDADGKIYDIEVQRADAGADVHRARFHSSILDTKMLKSGQKFKEIHDSYVIFITENDYMKMGLPMYHIERTVQESNTLFGDGSHIIYVNGNYKNNDDPVGKLMHDFRCTSAMDMFYDELKKPVRHFKETEGGRSQVCKAMEDRITNEKKEVAINLLALGRLTLEEIAKATGLAIETVTALAKEKTD